MKISGVVKGHKKEKSKYKKEKEKQKITSTTRWSGEGKMRYGSGLLLTFRPDTISATDTLTFLEMNSVKSILATLLDDF